MAVAETAARPWWRHSRKPPRKRGHMQPEVSSPAVPLASPCWHHQHRWARTGRSRFPGRQEIPLVLAFLLREQTPSSRRPSSVPMRVRCCCCCGVQDTIREAGHKAEEEEEDRPEARVDACGCLVRGCVLSSCTTSNSRETILYLFPSFLPSLPSFSLFCCAFFYTTDTSTDRSTGHPQQYNPIYHIYILVYIYSSTYRSSSSMLSTNGVRKGRADDDDDDDDEAVPFFLSG